MTRTRVAFIPLSYRAAAAFSTRSAEATRMARILIHEPHPDVRILLAAVVRRAGHDPVGHGELTNDETPELMILEPASADGLAAAARLRRRLEDLPLICTSIQPPSPATKALHPLAHLLKPFKLGERAGHERADHRDDLDEPGEGADEDEVGQADRPERERQQRADEQDEQRLAAHERPELQVDQVPRVAQPLALRPG